MLAPLLVALLSSASWASVTPNAEDFWYFQGELGYTVLSEACSDGYTACEDSGGGLAGNIGYQITPYFALQGGYRYLGQFERSQGSNQSEVKLSALELTAVGSYPLNTDWSVYGLVGASLGQSVYTNGTVLDNLSSNGMNLSPTVGTGVRYRLNNHWQTHAGIQWSPDMAGSTTDAGLVSLGIRYELPSTEPRQTVVVQSAPAEQQAKIKEVIIEKTHLTLPSITQNAFFGFNDATLTDVAKREITDVVTRLTTYPKSNVRLLGFSDSAGSTEVNKVMSERRVQAVAQYLKEQGVQPEQISMESFGKLDPSYSNETAEGRAMNRRVSLIMDAIVIESEK
nr:OmpA family protein [Vibrio sp. Isolate25]